MNGHARPVDAAIEEKWAEQLFFNALPGFWGRVLKGPLCSTNLCNS